jgi:DNA-binding MarR family transcriptional regulator
MKDASIGFLVAKASRAVNRMYQKRLSDHKITGPQSHILSLLASETQLSQSEIGNALNLDKANTSIMLKRLTTQGWLLSKPDSADRRRIIFRLSAKGKALAKKVAKVDAKVAVDLSELLGVKNSAAAEKILIQISAKGLE